MRGIERQSEYYGFVDPEIARFAAEREASQEIPADAEVESFLSGPRITAGMLDDRRGGGTRSFSRGPAPEGGRAVTPDGPLRGASRRTASSLTVYLEDAFGRSLAIESDPDAPMVFSFDRVTDAKNFIKEHRGQQGWFYDDDTGAMEQSQITDFRYSDGQQDRTDEMWDIISGSRVTARGYGSSPVPGQDYQIGDRVKLTDPREVVTVTEIDFDPSDPMSSTIEYEDDNGDPGYAYGRDVFRTAADDDIGEMAQRQVSDFSFNDRQADRTDEMRQLLGHRVTAASLPADPAAAIEQIADELGWSRQDPRALEFDDWIGDRFYNEGLEPTSADIGEIAAKARDLGWTPTDEQWLPTPGAQRLYDEFAGQGRLRTLLEIAARYERDEVQGDPMRAAIILDRNGVDARKVNFMVSRKVASNDPDMDLFHELFDRGMSWDEMGKEIAQRNYTDNEERKAFRKGWRAGTSGKDTEHYDRLTDSWPRNLMNAFFSAYEIVREYR